MLLQNSGVAHIDLKYRLESITESIMMMPKRCEQLPKEKGTCDTCKNKVEDEIHFVLECPLNETIRHNFLQKK